MRPLRYSINVTLDGCCDHRAIPADEDLHRHAAEILDQADALLFGRVTYEMMEAAWRPPAPTGARPDWMEPFAQTINAAKKYVVSSTLEQVDWNAELVRGDLGKAVQQLKRESDLAEILDQADALLFGRVTYEMMEAAWRPPAPTGARPDWMEPFAQTINAAKKYVVSSTLEQVDWNAELVRGDLGKAVQQLKRE